MKPKIYLPTILSALLIVFLFLPRKAYSEDKLLDILSTEMTRELTALKSQETPPYYMSYRVNAKHETWISASFGDIIRSADQNSRILTTNVRVGSHELDNTREIRGDYSFFMSDYGGGTQLPLDNNEDAIKSVLWLTTNDKYRSAVEKFAKVKANVAVKVAAEDTSGDFSYEISPNDYYEPPFTPSVYEIDKEKWESKLKKFSAMFLTEPNIYGGIATFRFVAERKYFVSSEGTKIAQNSTTAYLIVSGYIKSDDGMELPLYKSYLAFSADSLPSDEIIQSGITQMITKLKAMREAPVVDPYSGPAILDGRAAGVFFHEIFGHRVEGHRQKSENEGQTFKKKIGEKILPEDMSVIFAPDKKKLDGKDLVGYYLYDDEGVKGSDVDVVKDGIMKSFLMGRSPIENFPKSNGHGRAEAGYQPVARQSNLIVETTKPHSKAELRKNLIEACKKQNKPYGYLFMDITGGFTLTGRVIPNSFNVMPTEVYRIYADGRPDELVRGADFIGTPLAMFTEITEAGDDPQIFQGTCGAESGGVPVTACAPSILVNKIEIQKKAKSQKRPPILARPDNEKFMD